MRKTENRPDKPAVPRPVFMRALLLFTGGAGCLLVGIVISRVTGDIVTLGMSAILGVAFVTKGILLKRKINTGCIYCVTGVCVSITPKILGRYRRIELVNTDTGDGTHFVLPKKTVFKIGHVYHCYLDSPLGNQHQLDNAPQDGSRSRFFIAEQDLPTNGFLGFEDLGVYQEKPAVEPANNNEETTT